MQYLLTQAELDAVKGETRTKEIINEYGDEVNAAVVEFLKHFGPSAYSLYSSASNLMDAPGVRQLRESLSAARTRALNKK